MIDSHTHLHVCRPDDAELVAAARDAGVTRMLTVGTDGESCRLALAAAERFDPVYAAVGRHPNQATGFDDAALDDLRELAAHPRCAAIGETGLDFYRDRADPDDQQRAFEAQIGLARDTGKPLVIHTRDADEATIATLREHAAGVTVILHCFSMPDRLEECADEGWWISFAGNVTYPSAAACTGQAGGVPSALAAAAARAPAERLLVETDAPYLTAQAVRKQRNQPAFVVHTARFVAERRGLSYAELEALVERNAATLFGW